MSIAHNARRDRARRCRTRVATASSTALWRPHPAALAAALMGKLDQSLCPTGRLAIATIADRLRRLPCDNSLVAMDLHRIARDLEAIVARVTPLGQPAVPAATPSPKPSPALGSRVVSAGKR